MYRNQIRLAATAVAATLVLLLGGAPAFAAGAVDPVPLAVNDLPTVINNMTAWIVGILAAVAAQPGDPRPQRATRQRSAPTRGGPDSQRVTGIRRRDRRGRRHAVPARPRGCRDGWPDRDRCGPCSSASSWPPLAP
jgi:hypothetical protein